MNLNWEIHILNRSFVWGRGCWGFIYFANLIYISLCFSFCYRISTYFDFLKQPNFFWEHNLKWQVQVTRNQNFLFLTNLWYWFIQILFKQKLTRITIIIGLSLNRMQGEGQKERLDKIKEGQNIELWWLYFTHFSV